MDVNRNRRQILAAGGTIGLSTLLAACTGPDTTTTVPTSEGGSASVQPQTSSSVTFPSTDSCVLTPEESEGPYYFDVDSVRSDIREDRQGTQLRLAMRVRDASCQPISNAVVDIWHCDAGGEYSGFGRSDDMRFLRGAQVTNADGVVEFQTIYPGWYQGRATHIHFKVHLNNKTVLTSQAYFDEKINDAVYVAQPYTAHAGRRTTNDQDRLFHTANLLRLSQDNQGYLGVLTIGVRP
jgi:protocatechuate 3,4-dioxygenase beta subunit